MPSKPVLIGNTSTPTVLTDSIKREIDEISMLHKFTVDGGETHVNYNLLGDATTNLKLLAEFRGGMVGVKRYYRTPEKQIVCINGYNGIRVCKKAVPNKIRGMECVFYKIR